MKKYIRTIKRLARKLTSNTWLEEYRIIRLLKKLSRNR